MRKSFLSVLFGISLLASPVWAAIDFDGADDSFFGTFASLDNLGDSAYYFRIYWEGGETYPRLFNTEVGAASRTLAFISNAGDATQGLISFNRDGTTELQSQTAVGAVTVNNEFVIIIIYDGTTNATGVDIYVNGTQSEGGSPMNGAGFSSDVGQTIYIGNRSDTLRTFNGIIREIAIWNDDVLTAADIALLTNSKLRHIPLQVQASALVAYWTLDNQPSGTTVDGDTINDFSASGNNLTGSDGANNTGLTWTAESILTYP